MPYIIVAVILIIGAGAFFVLQPGNEMAEQTTATTEEAARIDLAEEETDDTDDTPSGGDAAGSDVFTQEADVATTDRAEPTREPDNRPVATTGATGSFTGDASYSTGRTIHELAVTLTLEGDIVTASNIQYDGQAQPPTPILRSFNDAYRAQVIGRDIDDIQLSRVGGASWTSDAFNEAVDAIKQQRS